MLNDTHKHNMYGDMTEDEINIVYRGIDTYRGWKCTFVGLGSVVFTKVQGKSMLDIRAYRGDEVKNWVPECWKEIKEKIDNLMDA